jgi:hypothetical protein
MDYSQGGMGHVDTFDASLARFNDHRNTSWRRTHFLAMLKMSIVNAWVMYCALLEKKGEQKKAKRLSMTDFMGMLKLELTGPWFEELAAKKEAKEKKCTATRTEQRHESRKKAKLAKEKEEQEEGLLSHFRVNRDASLNSYLLSLQNPK